MIQKPRGTLDILPGESEIWQQVEAVVRKTASLYGFREIRLPTFEMSELYKRGVGETTDVVQKEMYTFCDNDRRSITLRPEGTAGVVRSVIENSLGSLPLPLSLYYLISCFRYEKPEAGRSREFYQFGVEQFGAEDAAADANVIALAAAVFRELGLKRIRLELNSIGCKHCRPGYRKALHDHFEARKADLCPTCLERLDKNPLRILDCKSPICQKIAADAPLTVDHLCPDCDKHFHDLQDALTAAGIPFHVNPRIVRGLDYYQRTVFEFISDAEGCKSTVCGGGRYDGMVEELGGPALSGIGFAMGLTRILLAMKEENILPQISENPKIYLASMGERSRKETFLMAEKLRASGVRAAFDQVGRSLKAQMKYADKTGAAYTVVIGDSELDSGKANLKNMTSGECVEVSLADTDALIQALK